MRLIDADEFIKKFRYAEANTEDEKIMCATVRRMIKEQPTAFDVEKVVREFRDLKMRYYLTIANTGDADKDCAYLNIANAIDKAIEIVKRGGRDEE